MTRKLPLRRAGAAALGAALIGYGVVRSDLVDWDQEPRPPDPGPKLPQNPRKLVLPEPKFGWPVGMQAQDPAQEVRKALKPAARERSNRADLLASTSDQALLIPPEPQVETPPQPVVAEPQAEILPPGPELVRPDQPTDNKIEIAVLNDPLPAPVFGLPPGSGLELPDLPPEFLQQLEQAEAHYADAAEATAEIGPAATDLAQVEAPEPPAQTSSFAPPVLAKANTSAPGPPEQASDPVAEPGPTASVFSNIAAPGTLTRADPALATLADDVDSDHAAAGEEEATAPPAATPASTPPRLASRPVSDGSGVASTSGAAPSVASSGPAPPLSELVPERPETRTRLALASVVPTTAKPGPADQLQIPGSPELDQVEALARANARSLLNFTSGPPSFTYEDELILDVQVKGVEVSDTIFAYGTREGIFLPVGTFARILDLALVLSDGGHYASGWTLDEDRTLTLDLRNGVAILQGKEQVLPPNVAAAFDGEMYLRSDMFQRFLPLDVQIDLRMQRVLLETLEPFPFQERAKREANRIRLASRQSAQELHWPREETPWRLFSVPLVDLEMRALSDRARGDRLEGDFRVSGDLAYLTAEAFLSADTKDGLTASLITLGRTDPDAELLGPLQATSFSFGDISTTSMPIGLRGVTGRGVTLSNTPPESASVFENIDLRGILPDGYEVELYRNDVLIGSTAQAINGQYEFLQVPVDFGLNVLRLVFYGPQGQRSEQVRRITVGDGRLARGKFVYRLGAAQKDENVLGVRGPFYVPPDDLGAWRLTGEIGYGLTSGITATASGAWFQTPDEDKWLVSSGIRTGIGQFAIRSDISFADGGAWAVGAGVGGRFGDSTFTLDHTEYSGDFIDETKTIGREFLKRSTELDFNTTLNLGNPVSGLTIPITARLRHFESQAGRKQLNASLRASTRLSGILASNTLEYTRNSFPQLKALSQLYGNFDLTTLGRSKLRGRASLGYQVLPSPDLISTAIEADYSLDNRTSVRGRFGYSFLDNSAQVGASAIREFKDFTLSFDGNYGFSDKNYSVGLRLAASFGRNPQNGRFFMARPGLSSMGAASMRAYQDLDGDGLFGPTDRVLPDVDFVAFNQTAKTDADGIALLGGLGNGQRVNLQVDRSSLPDIALAPASTGIEIVPRPGRIHRSDFAIVALSEIEGQVDFVQASGSRGVSGVRLQLRDKAGEVVGHARTEVDGYYFFEEVKPGEYDIVLDQEQAERLKLCLSGTHHVKVGYEADIYQQPIQIAPCE